MRRRRRRSSGPPSVVKATERGCPSNTRRGATAMAVAVASSRVVVGHLVRVGHDDAGGDEVLRKHRVRPLVHVARPAVLPVREELGRRARVVDLVEVLAARQVEAPEAEDEGEGDEADEEQRVTAIQATGGLAQVRVRRVRCQPAQVAARGRRTPVESGLVERRRRRIGLDRRRPKLGRRERQAHRAPRHDREDGGDEEAEQPDAAVGEERRGEEFASWGIGSPSTPGFRMRDPANDQSSV